MRRLVDPRAFPIDRVVPVALLLVMIAIGCSVQGRHRVLTFFFDGVPPMETDLDRLAAEAGDTMTTGSQTVAFAPVILSVHEPVRARKCGACHGVGGNNLMVIADDITLCDQCHGDKRAEQQWAHGPINQGTCYPCHVPHKSQHPSLLAMAIPDLCATCHQELRMEEEYHAVPNFQDCLACHDPHRIR